jgi:hypothetical protein
MPFTFKTETDIETENVFIITSGGFVIEVRNNSLNDSK